MKLTKTIFLTRSSKENLELRVNINDFVIKQPDLNTHFNFIDCPLISYIDIKLSQSFFEELDKYYTNVIITSKYAATRCGLLKSNETERQLQRLKFWVVGPSSAAILREAGFVVEVVAVNVAKLLEILPKSIYSQSMYLSGDKISHNLPEEIKREIIYSVKYLDSFDPVTVDSLKKGVDYIFIYSTNCAKTLSYLLIKHNLLKLLENTIIIAVSSKVASELKPYFNNVIYCKDGDQDKIIDLMAEYESGYKAKYTAR